MRILFLILSSAAALAQSGIPIPRGFFAVSTVGGSYPPFAIGGLAHQEFAWSTVEQKRGDFDFTLLDLYVESARQHGLVDSTNTVSIAITLANGTPAWAVSSKSKCTAALCTLPPDDLQDWKDFVSAIVRHYDGSKLPHIRYYELWNEINVPLSWTGTNAQMVALAQAAYPIVHQDRYSQLLTPSVAGPAGRLLPSSQVTAMTAYLKAGGVNYADGGAFHGYIAAQTDVDPFPMPEQDATPGCQAFVTCYGSIVTLATQMRGVFDTFGMEAKPILQTEGGWGYGTVTDPILQVAWLSRYLLLQAGLRSTANLQMAAWFAWSPSRYGWGTLADINGQPTPAAVAYGQLLNWLAGASVTRSCTSTSDGTWMCAFSRPGGYVAEAVWNTQGRIKFTPGLSYTQFRDLRGNTTTIDPDAEIEIGQLPVLVEGTAPGSGFYPVISLVANAAGEMPAIAANTWVEVKGFNLARVGYSRIWKDSDFANNQLPRQLDGTSVSVNGKAAFIYFISPTQLNILTPPDAISGSAAVQVTVNGITSPTVNVPAVAISPSLFLFGAGPYVTAEHANGKLLGPAGLFPGLTTPAAPGETVLLFGNGFGPTVTPIQSGLPVQSGRLVSLPDFQIGGIPAKVIYAGLTGIGQFQFNVVIPEGAAAGDQTITAAYNGLSTQPGVLINIQP